MDSVLFIVDMNNGFAREGALSSERVEKIIPNIVKVIEEFKDNDSNIALRNTISNKSDVIALKSNTNTSNIEARNKDILEEYIRAISIKLSPSSRTV